MTDVYDGLREAIGACDDEGAIVTKFITIAEVIRSDGSATIQTISDVDHAWQVLGMLHHALLIVETEKYNTSEDEE
jgi:hypothetical protein